LSRVHIGPWSEQASTIFILLPFLERTPEYDNCVKSGSMKNAVFTAKFIEYHSWIYTILAARLSTIPG
ncbi:MAG TPA: hypothetical protein VHD63_09315, partial [Ktedonobacteraceae bacterium]|nr:hypothetical protein [Ktedonobacteraceae bacterium]